jgi:hypothetical protein
MFHRHKPWAWEAHNHRAQINGEDWTIYMLVSLCRCGEVRAEIRKPRKVMQEPLHVKPRIAISELSISSEAPTAGPVPMPAGSGYSEPRDA